MPELPEVDTIKNQINQVMPLKIVSVQKSRVSDSIIHTPMQKLKSSCFVNVERKGKMLILNLDDERKLLCHLGMTGGWRISESKVTEKHTHLQFEGLHNKRKVYLAYVDPRRFGHMYLYNSKDAQKKLSELGTDLKSQEFTHKYFSDMLLKYPGRFLKVTLLDQKLFAGTGNYIASEICAHAKIRPDRLVKSLTSSEIKKLYKAVFTVIDGALSTGGTTFQGGYADTTGSKGNGVQHLVVFYQKTCQMCMKNPVTKIVLAQRGTYYCSRCQK